MTLRRSRPKSSKKSARRTTVRRKLQPNVSRFMRLEGLEDRRLMAIGPELVAILANDGSLIRQSESVLHVAPRDLTLRFDDGQVIDASTLAAIQISQRVGNTNVPITPGYVGIGEAPNEVVIRFADTLPDGEYTLTIGSGTTQLRNINGNPYENVGRVKTPVNFSLNLGARVLAVVPQPLGRDANGALTQIRHRIDVYFNDDDLHPHAVTYDPASDNNPTVVDPQFYRLIFTNDSVTNQDDQVFFPSSISYDPATDKAELIFLDAAGDPLPIDQLVAGGGTFRLRIGTNEALPAPPVTVQASITATTDFNTNHQVEVFFAPVGSVAEGNEIRINFTQQTVPAGSNESDPAVTVPDIAVSGRTINVTLKAFDLSDPTRPGTTAEQLVKALNAHPQARALVNASIAGGGQKTNIASRRIDYGPIVLTDAGSQFSTATNVTPIGSTIASEFNFSFDVTSSDPRAKSIIISGAIDKQVFGLQFPGAADEPGHRDIPVSGHLGTPPFYSPANTASEQAGTDVADRTPGITTIPYNFREIYGRNPVNNQPFRNAISEEQKERVREALEIYGSLLGVQFVETFDQGIVIASGDLRALGGVSQRGGVLGLAGSNNYDGRPTVVLDNAEDWSDVFGVSPQTPEVVAKPSFFEIVTREIGNLLGLGNSFDLPPVTVQGEEPSLGQSSTGVPFDRFDNIIPGDHDILHGQHLYRPDSKDIDVYRFQVNEFGRFTAETFAERRTVASHLDTVISLYREEGSGERTLIARNDDYYSRDSFLELDLIPGVYYVVVTASGNINFDPENPDTGIGGTTDGPYDLRLGFRPRADASIIDIDMAGNLSDAQPLDGDGDGVPGGVFDFWFRALPPMNPLTGNGGTVYVDKAFQPTGVNTPNGTLARPFTEIDEAFAFIASRQAMNPDAQFIVRIAGNNGTANRPTDPPVPLDQRLPYVFGQDQFQPGQSLPDGFNLEVPKNVTVMIDEGAVFKMRRASVIVGSSEQGSGLSDRSGGALQVLGVPNNNVIFTSINDDAIGIDTNPTTTTAMPGEWGGIVIRNDVDRAAPDERFDYERQGIFLNYINQADLRYGGGLVSLGSVEQVVTPIFMIDARPTVSYNTITRSADAAMSANPDSFEESNFHDPATQRLAYDVIAGDQPFTLDYQRVGPAIYGNRLVMQEPNPLNPTQPIVHQNRLNGLFIRIATPNIGVTETMTISGRFDDTDIVHILQENLEIEGTPGGLRTERYEAAQAPVADALPRRPDGQLEPGIYIYFVTFVDADGVESPASPVSPNTVLGSLPTDSNAIRVTFQQPATGNFVAWRLYRLHRTDVTSGGPFKLITHQPITGPRSAPITFTDLGTTLLGSDLTPHDPNNPLDRAEADKNDYLIGPARPTATPVTGGTLVDGTYNWIVTFVGTDGIEGPASPVSRDVVIQPGSAARSVRLDIEQPTLGEYSSWRLYRSSPTGRGPYTLVAERPATVASFLDTGGSTGLPFTGSFVHVNRTRADARLKIDPSVIVKLHEARIEASMGAQIIAEGLDGREVVFTSLFDQRYGAGGTFNTANSTLAPAPGNWGGVYVGHTGSASIDQAIFAYGGGATRIEGIFANFNTLEIHQATARVANSVFEYSGDGTRVLGPEDDIERVGRGRNSPGVIFVRGAQPILINNIIRNQSVTAAAINPAITINVNALNSDRVIDWGRTTGPIDLFTEMLDNQGPLIRNNILVNTTANVGAINGLLVRGNVLTTEGVWDDTDIVHVLLNEVLIPDFHSKGGLRLESSANESLVVKLFGVDAGFAATGRPLEIDDRIGGSLYIVGQPNHPVVLTSLRDDTIGAGQTLDGRPQFDTNNDGIVGVDATATAPAPGDWRSIRLLEYSNDRNVATIVEREANNVEAPGLNAVTDNAQFLGQLGRSEYGGDETLRLGFEVHGFLTARNDVDIYSFSALPGTEVWIDLDNTTHSLDAVVELINASGVVIARSDNSVDEANDPSLLFRNNNLISPNRVNPLKKSAFGIDDHYTTNPRDAGLRVVLPGSPGVRGTYYVRVRSAGPGVLVPNDQILGGRSMGAYELQIRLQELDEVPGSTITFSEIRYATRGIDIEGLPKHSPLVGEVVETNAPNQTRANAQYLGNLLNSDRGAISVAGSLAGVNPEDPAVPNLVGLVPDDPDDVDWYSFDIGYDSIGGVTDRGAAIVFDLDYADNLGRPDIRLSIFDSAGRLILSSDDSGVANDLSDPNGASGAFDLKRGSGGELDPFIGPIQLPPGRYYVAVSHAGDMPIEIAQRALSGAANPLTRIEPIDSINRVVEYHVDSIQNYPGPGSFVPTRPAATLTSLFTNESFAPFDLSDVTLFVVSDAGPPQTSRLHYVDALTGQYETTAGVFNWAVGDIAMRGTGELFAYSIDTSGPDSPNDAESGNFLKINTGDGSAVNLRDDGIETYELDANGAQVRTHPFPDANGTRIGHGIQFNAMAFNRTATRLFAVGNRGGNYPGGADYTSNILFRMVPTNTPAGGLEGQPNSLRPAAGNTPFVGRAGTNAQDQGEIPTAVDLFTDEFSVLVTPRVTTVPGTGGAPNITGLPAGLTEATIRDGERFTVEVTDGNGVTTVFGPFEINTGPEALVNFDVSAGQFILDGEFFTLTTPDNVVHRFEFDTGVVLITDGFQTGDQLDEGALITITDNTGNIQRFELDTNNQVQAPNIPIMVDDNMTPLELLQRIEMAINNAPFNVVATVDPINGRLSLLNDANVVLSAPQRTGLLLSGGYGVSPGSTAIPVEETFTAGEVLQRIQFVIGSEDLNGNRGYPGIDAYIEGSRITFNAGRNAQGQLMPGPVSGNFDSNDTIDFDTRGTPRYMSGLLGASGQPSDGNVAPNAIEIELQADDTREEVAQKIINAVNNAMLNGLTAVPSNPPSNSVNFVADTILFGPNATVQVVADPTSPFRVGGGAPGGNITGLAFVGQTLYAVSDNGGLYRIDNPDAVAQRDPVNGTFYVQTDYINTAVDLVGINFQGLSAGPPNLQGGRYADILFGITNTGRIYAFDTQGVLQPVFANGATFVDTGIVGARGLAFSTLDYNLWHVTSYEPENGDPFRHLDEGHGMYPTPTNAHDFQPNPRELNSSLYFGNALRDWAFDDAGLQTIFREGRAVTSLGQEPGDRLTYDFPGGAHGTIVSEPFSLKGYTAADQPALYFNYFLATENVDSLTEMRDSFRVFVSSDDPSLPVDPVFSSEMIIQGQWYLAATNNAAGDGPSPLDVQLLHDNTDVWRQVKIDLGPFAGLENIRLRFDFSTAGSMDTAGTGTETGGEELRVIPASELRDGQTFNIGGNVFEFDLGVTLVAPTGNAIVDGETFVIENNVMGQPNTFEFDSDNTFRRNIQAKAGSQFRDGDTFSITGPNGQTRLFEFDSGYTIVVPSLAGRPGGLEDGDTFTIDDGLGTPNSVKTYEFDFDGVLNDPSHIAVDVTTDQALVIPSQGGAFGGVGEGHSFTITDMDGVVFTFEYDAANNGVAPGNIEIDIAPTSSQNQVANATVAAINSVGAMMNPPITASHLGNGLVRLGTRAVSVSTNSAPTITVQPLPGTRDEIADRIVEAIQNSGQAITPRHTMRNGAFTGEVHIGGNASTVLNTSGSPALRQLGRPGLNDPNAVAVGFVPDDSFTAEMVADSIVNAIQSSGLAMTPSAPADVVLIPGATFSPRGTALTPAGVVPVPYTAAQSAAEVAAAIAAAITSAQIDVIPHVVGNRVNLEDTTPGDFITVLQSAAPGQGAPALVREGAAGTTVGVPIVLNSTDDVITVRDKTAEALNAFFAPQAQEEGYNAFTTYANTIRVYGRSIINAGPLGTTSERTARGVDALPGDSRGSFNEIVNPAGPALRGLNNRHEGVYIDDIIVGFAERGEMVTNSGSGSAAPDTFVHVGNAGAVGEYQLEIRRVSEYGVGQLLLARSFDTNDRLSQDFTLFAPEGARIAPRSGFTLSDGVDTVTFEFVNQNLPGAAPLPGNVAIFYSPNDSAAAVAVAMAQAINSTAVQVTRGLDVTASVTPTSNRVDLVGENVIANIVNASLVIEEVVTDANVLRDAILGSDVRVVGDARFVGGDGRLSGGAGSPTRAFSAGLFSGGTTSIGLESGIVLSTGDVREAQPNFSAPSELSSGLGDPELDAYFGVTTDDTTYLEFDFELDATQARDLFFNFVFASNEYLGDRITDPNDVFAVFIDGQLVTLVPGTQDPVGINTVNGGNPLGSGAANPQYFVNNAPGTGQFRREFGLNGFTTPLTATVRGLAPGVHTVRIVISDVADADLFDPDTGARIEDINSMVFIQAGSFSSQEPAPLVRQGVTGVQFNDIGDENRIRDQGQLIISSNRIFDSAEWGIVVDSTRDPVTGQTSPGAVRNLEELNDERLVPGVVITNNIVARSGVGGLLFSGEATVAGQPDPAVPFGRIVNNTFYGINAGDVGIQVEENAGPTLLNNIVANFETGITVDASSQPNTVIANTLFQDNTTNSNVGLQNGDSRGTIVLAAGEPLFANPDNNNFYLEAGSRAIDTGLSSLQERQSLANVKASVGIPPSPIVVPERDALGQFRRSGSGGAGGGTNVFVDRGAIDRVDFVGPTAEMAVPRDNDAEGRDQNPAVNLVKTSGQRVSQFDIKLLDGVDPIDPFAGTGIDDSTVTADKVRVEFFDPDDVNLTSPTLLQLGVDYIFAYNPLNDTISISDVGGLYPPGFYRITLDNSPTNPTNPNDDGIDAIYDIAGNPLQPNRPTGETVFVVEIPEDLDFGDAPESYGTSIDSDGPRHTIRPNFFLGTQVDAELDGVPSIAADGDGADEDGVRIRGGLLAGATMNVGATVALEVFASAPGRLDAWIDFNRNGVFEPSEKIADNLPLNSAANTINVTVPEVPIGLEDTLLGPTYARFRFSSVGGLGPTGPAIDGEVEDYQIILQRSDSLWQNPSNNLDVNGDGVVTILDALLVVNDIRDNNQRPNQPTPNIHQLFPTRAQAEAANQLFVQPGAAPFVDVNGDSLVTVADLQQIIAALRAQISSGMSGEAENAAVSALSALAAEGEASGDYTASETDTSTTTLPLDFSTRQQPSNSAGTEQERKSSNRFNDELVLANSRFRTFEFEAALADIANDVSEVWTKNEEDEVEDLEDYFPFDDILDAQPGK